MGQPLFDQARFDQILESARSRTPVAGLDTLVVHAHLAQMRLFMQKSGVEWVPRQDSFGQRTEFLRRVIEYNELPGRLDGIIDSFLIDGRGLLYFRPSKDLYRIHYFTKSQYRTYYDEEGDLEEVQIIYSYVVRAGNGAGSDIIASDQASRVMQIDSPNSEIRWIKIRVRIDKITQVRSSTRPNFGINTFDAGVTQDFPNSLGFIPAVEVFNNRGLQAGSGHGEFDWLAGAILQHDRMLRNIRSNLNFFGGPTLVSSRPRHDLVEQDGEGQTGRATIASNSGFVGLNRASTRTIDPAPSMGAGLRVPRIIANVEAADRVAYITPDSVGGDLVMHAQNYQEMIRSALGGVDDLSINSGATAYEVRTLYGRVAATAKRKCRDLYEYGFCKLFSLMIYHEEMLFRESLGQALGIAKPEPVLAENLQVTPEQLQALEQKYETAMTAWRQRIGDAINNVKNSGEIPPDVVGLLPDGITQIDWRWMGEIFEDSSQEILQNSIVCRNLQELGVSSIESLRHLFPQKTPEERAAMLTGYPFRMVEATQRSVGIFSDLMRSMFQVPHPQEPDLPLSADPNLDLVPYLYRTLSFLRQELSYTGNYHDVEPSSNPPTISDADRLRASRGEPTEHERVVAERRRALFASHLAHGWAGSGYPAGMAAGVQPAGVSDASSPLPGLGGTLAFDPERPDAGAGHQLGQLASAFQPGIGAADLLAPTNAGILPGGPAIGGQPGGGSNPRQPAGSTAAGSPAAGSTAPGGSAAGRSTAGRPAAGAARRPAKR